MSNSITKKKIAAQKENSHRLSKSKLNAFSSVNLSKIYSTELVCPQSHKQEDKQRNSSKRTARLKSGRTNQINLQFILNQKVASPYSMRNVQTQKEKQKGKNKKRKANRMSNENSKFIIPVGDFSKSNSLIVFSQKNSTIDNKKTIKEEMFIFNKGFTPAKAATIIQKNWRGYLTRKLLDQYIMDEELKLNEMMEKIASREESFMVEQKENQYQFEELSEIRDSTMNLKQLKVYYSEKIGEKDSSSDKKPFVLFTTQNQSNVYQKCHKNESPPMMKRSFFNNHQTEPDQTNRKITSLYKSTKKTSNNFIIHSNYNETVLPQKTKSPQPFQLLQQKIKEIKAEMSAVQTQGKMMIKSKLRQNEIDLDEMIVRNEKIKQIYANSVLFLNDVHQQLMAIVNEIKMVAADGLESLKNNYEDDDESDQDNNKIKKQPKSQMFTIDLPDHAYRPAYYASFDLHQEEQHKIIQHFSEGQLKLQTYLTELVDEYKQNYKQDSELEYLCQILKINSEQGIKNILQRCLVQFTVEIITENYPIGQLLALIYKQRMGKTKDELFLLRWIQELNKWQMGPIQQVTQHMESSSFINLQSKLHIAEEN